MAVEINVQAWVPGIVMTFQDADATGNTFENDNDRRTFIFVETPGARVITFHEKRDCEFQHALEAGAAIDSLVSLSAGISPLGPFDPLRYNEDGKVEISFDDHTGVRVAAVRYPAR